MSMQTSFTEPLRRVSDITPEDLDAYLREARRQRSLAFASIIMALGRAFARPFRRREASPGSGTLATKLR